MARPARRRRRRLRREVRLVGYSLMMVSPLILGTLMLAGSRRDARPPFDCGVERADFAAATHRPVISISLEPSASVPGTEVEPPVVLPGYLLPVDASEEPAHAGS